MAIASVLRKHLTTPLAGIAEDPDAGSGSADINASVLRGLGPERRGKNDLDMRKIATCFHLPIDTAAKALGIGSTAIKRICRKHGLDRWPHRKLKCIERTISDLKSRKGSDSGDLQKSSWMRSASSSWGSSRRAAEAERRCLPMIGT